MEPGWPAVQATLFNGLSDLLHRFGHVKSNHDVQDICANLFRGEDPLLSALAFSLLVSVVVWALGLATHKHSWVDKLWSLLPIAYAWHFATHDLVSGTAAAPDPRLVLIAALITVWGVRLTYNFARKGGYRWQDEDYRWPVIRAQTHPAVFQVFALVFIAFIQNLLLLALTAPVYVAWQHRGTPVNWVDAVAAGAMAGFIVLEAVADQQQWVFQEAKKAKRAAGKRLTGDFHRGFLTSGLFKYSRHPNFFAEQSIWWCVYLFSVAASGLAANWSAAGALALVGVFQGSTWLTEKLTAAKYPKYAEYQQTTSCFLPLPPFPKRISTARPVAPSGAPSTPVSQRRRRSSRAGAGEESPEASPKAAAAAEAALLGTPAAATRSRRRAAAAAAGGGEAEFDSEGAGGARGGATPRTRRSTRVATAAAEPTPRTRRARAE